MPIARLVYDGDWVYTEKEKRIHKLTSETETKIDSIPGVINDVNSTSTTDALSANMGKLLQDQINNLAGRWTFLSNWDCATWLPETDPLVDPYEYKAWNYYIVSHIDDTTNYRPHGSTYVSWQPSTAVETEEIWVNDWYIYDGTQWLIQTAANKSIAIDDWLSTTSTNPVENRVITNALTTKQNNILDLQTIRSWAAAWATALQPWANITELTNNANYATEWYVNSAVSADANTKTFCLANTSDLTNAQEAYDWWNAWKEAIIILESDRWIAWLSASWNNWEYRFLYDSWSWPTFVASSVVEQSSSQWVWWRSLNKALLTLTVSGWDVTAVTKANSVVVADFLSTSQTNHPFYPANNYDPATKRYVDDSIESTKSSWSTAPANPEAGTIWYNTTNNTTYIYNWSSREEVITNTKTFYLSWIWTSAAVLAEAQAIYDRWLAGKNPIIIYDNIVYVVDNINNEVCYFRWDVGTGYAAVWASDSYVKKQLLSFDRNWNTVEEVKAPIMIMGQRYLSTVNDYATPYVPQYDGSPATKKYVDDSITATKTSGTTAPSNPDVGALWYDTTNNVLKIWNWTDWVVASGDMFYSDFNFVTKTGSSITLDLSSEITPDQNFTVNAPVTIKDWQEYVLRVTNGATVYTMTLGTGISNPNSLNLTLTPNKTNKFTFLAVGWVLELQPDWTNEIVYVTAQQYNDLPSTKLTDWKSYFIYE